MGPSTGKEKALPNCFALTLVGVGTVSLRFAPVRALSYCEVVTWAAEDEPRKAS
jgi:hypothetical protein